MNVNKVKLIYFSPTQTTKTIVSGIAQGMGIDTVSHLDLTPPTADTMRMEEMSDELVVIGVPVYEGRVAGTAIYRLKRLRADNTPAVVVVVYGNRDFEDALIELNDLAEELGFIPVAGGAFIGEHSFATDTRPMANGRPDGEDMTAAEQFGSKIRDKMRNTDSVMGMPPVEIPGNRPYISRDRSGLADRSASTQEEICTLCGTCESCCPVGAITVEDTVKTDNMACILCCACVKNCPTGARQVADPTINKIANWVSKNFQARREPVTFI
jgi:ferredoxin